MKDVGLVALTVLASLPVVLIPWLFRRLERGPRTHTMRELPRRRRWRIRLMMVAALLPGLVFVWALSTGHTAVALAVIAALAFVPPLTTVPVNIRCSRRGPADE